VWVSLTGSKENLRPEICVKGVQSKDVEFRAVHTRCEPTSSQKAAVYGAFVARIEIRNAPFPRILVDKVAACDVGDSTEYICPGPADSA